MLIAFLAFGTASVSDVSTVIATFASVGFALFLAVPAILTAAQPALERRLRNPRHKAHRDYLLNELSKETTIDGFLYDAVIFVVSGILDVLYVGIGSIYLLFASWLVLLVALALVVVDMSGLALLVSYYIPKGKKELEEFKAETETHLPRVRRIRCNSTGCGRLFKTRRGLNLHRSLTHGIGGRNANNSNTNAPATQATSVAPIAPGTTP